MAVNLLGVLGSLPITGSHPPVHLLRRDIVNSKRIAAGLLLNIAAIHMNQLDPNRVACQSVKWLSLEEGPQAICCQVLPSLKSFKRWLEERSDCVYRKRRSLEKELVPVDRGIVSGRSPVVNSNGRQISLQPVELCGDLLGDTEESPG